MFDVVLGMPLCAECELRTVYNELLVELLYGYKLRAETVKHDDDKAVVSKMGVKQTRRAFRKIRSAVIFHVSVKSWKLREGEKAKEVTLKKQK